MLRRTLLACAPLIACPLLGCGSSSSTFSTAHVERAIARSILVQRNVHATVHCPPRAPRKAGASFTCIAYLDVGSYPIAATVTNSKGQVRYASSAPLVVLDIRKVRAAIASSILSQRHLRAAVRCPKEVLQRAGITFTCTATVNGKSYPFEVTETDDKGHVRYLGR